MATSKRKQKELIGLEWLDSKMLELGYVSYQEVADKIGTNKGNLYRYFSLENSPSIKLLPKLCEVFESSPHEILRALSIRL